MQRGFLLTRHSTDRYGKTLITLWFATDIGPCCVEISGERPVFFVKAGQLEEVKELLRNLQGGFEANVLDLKTFDQCGVAAIYLPTIQSFYNAQQTIRLHNIETLEGDIRLHDRFLMERGVRGSALFKGRCNPKNGYTQFSNAKVTSGQYKPSLKVISLDIECSSKGELYSIAFYGKEIKIVLMVGPEDSFESDSLIHWLPDERSLLLQFVKTIQGMDPDVIIGWNIVNFDFRLLLTCAKKYGLSLRIGRDHSSAIWRDSRSEQEIGFLTIPGRVVIDGITALKTATYSFSSFSLESVSRELLGRGKLVDKVTDRQAEITNDFLHDKPKLAAYNLEDCRLVWDIFRKTQILDFLIYRSQLTGLELDRQGGSVAAFTNLYMPRLHRSGYVAPNLPVGGGLVSPGGYVMDSYPGLYSNILVLDFKSLYPSIIRTFKIDPLGLIEGLLSSDDPTPGYKGAFFSRHNHLLPEIIASLWKERDMAKSNNDFVRSQALKIIMNSFYGVLGSGGCRFYDPRLSSSITLRGRDILKQTGLWLSEKGYKIIYGDTDSLFVHVDGDLTSEGVRKLGNHLAAQINNNWKDTLSDKYGLDSYLELEFETHYRRFFMPTIRGSDTGTKKRYAGLRVQECGHESLVFKGLESVRTDWTDLAKEFQEKLYSKIFADENVIGLIIETVFETRAGQRDHQLVYHKRLGQPLDAYIKNIPPHVKAARFANEMNRKKGGAPLYRNKGRVSYVNTVCGPEPVEYRRSAFDYEHYVEKQLKPIADAILPFVGLTFSEVINSQIDLF